MVKFFEKLKVEKNINPDAKLYMIIMQILGIISRLFRRKIFMKRF